MADCMFGTCDGALVMADCIFGTCDGALVVTDCVFGTCDGVLVVVCVTGEIVGELGRHGQKIALVNGLLIQIQVAHHLSSKNAARTIQRRNTGTVLPKVTTLPITAPPAVADKA